MHPNYTKIYLNMCYLKYNIDTVVTKEDCLWSYCKVKARYLESSGHAKCVFLCKFGINLLTFASEFVYFPS